MSKSVTSIIKDLGFTFGTQEDRVKAFQRAWNLGPALLMDGVVGVHTAAAANKSWDLHVAGHPDLSRHFGGKEFACHCGGKLVGCKHLVLYRGLLESLETLREIAYPAGLSIVSGYRCVRYNVKVGGAERSRHITGLAADIPGRLTVESMRSRRLFGGLGYQGDTRLVVHVDRRDVESGSRATRSNPTMWAY
jgi:hypothetical protein